MPGPGDLYNDAIVLLAQSAVPVTLTGTTVETTLRSIVVPGGVMGPSGALWVAALFSSTNNANAKTVAFRLGGTSLQNPSWSTFAAVSCYFLCSNRGALNSQITSRSSTSFPDLGTSAFPTVAVNTGLDQPLVISALLANAADVLTLEFLSVVVHRG